MKNIKTKIIFLFAAALIVFSACQSVQKDPHIIGEDEKVYEELGVIEETVVKLDGKGANREELAGARQQITDLETTADDSDFQGRLAAWSGRLYLMEGRNSDAREELLKSQNLSPRNLPARIL